MGAGSIVAFAKLIIGGQYMSFVHGRELTAAIRAVVAKPSDIAVAFWGNDACERLGLPKDLKGYRIACDARSGACSPIALKTLLRRGAAVVDVPRLHAKVYRSADAMVTSSANASGGGLCEDELARFGLEAGVVLSDTTQLAAAAKWFGELFKMGSPITKADIAEITPIWDAARRSRPARQSLIDAILAQAPELVDRSIQAYVYTAEEPSSRHGELYDGSPYGEGVSWRDLEDLPFFFARGEGQLSVGDELLCFEIDEDGEVSCERVWKVLDLIRKRDVIVYPAAEITRPLGRPLGDGREVARLVKAALAAGRLVADSPPMSLPEFAAAIADTVAEDHIARIRSEAARAAYRLLSDAAPRLGFAQSRKSGHVPSARWHVGRHYPFSFIPNQQDLLFYVRKPALDAAPHLAVEARDLGLVWNENKAGETTLRIPDATAAQTVLSWLAPKLPLKMK